MLVIILLWSLATARASFIPYNGRLFSLWRTDSVPLTVLKPASPSAKIYKPVILIHGLKDHIESLQNLVDTIRKEHGGTDVHNIDMLHGVMSFMPLMLQIDQFYSAMLPIMQKAPNGVILIGYSQGGLIARGILEMKWHNVKTFISLSSPQGGQYGDAFLKQFSPYSRSILKKDLYLIVYSSLGQKLSFANYWNDPFHQDLYLTYAKFLPYVDNVKENYYNASYKANLEQLERMVLIGGPDDGTIAPWQSSYFCVFDISMKVVDFRDRNIFTQNLFGLQTLYDANKVTIYEVPNITHLEWHQNQDVIHKYILPWLN